MGFRGIRGALGCFALRWKIARIFHDFAELLRSAVEISFPECAEGARKSFAEFARVGFLLHSGPEVPVWMGEFGTCQQLDCGPNSDWFRLLIQLLQKNDLLSWSYWALNGTQSSGVTRKYDTVETFGLLSPNYSRIEATSLVGLLRTVETQPKQ